MTAHQVVVWPDPKQLSEVAEGHRGVGFKPEVWVVMGWCEVAAFTVQKTSRETRVRDAVAQMHTNDPVPAQDKHLGKKMLSTM